MFNPDGSLTCCNKKWKNCPTVTPWKNGAKGFTIEGDDGQSVDFSLEQFEVLMEEGQKLLEDAGL